MYSINDLYKRRSLQEILLNPAETEPEAPERGAKLYTRNTGIYSKVPSGSVTCLVQPEVYGLSGCVAWYDASEISGLTDGDAISSIVDKTGNNNTLEQATADLKPIYKANIKNGLSVARFDGANDFLISPVMALSMPATIFAVVLMRGLASYSSIYDGITNNTMNTSGKGNNAIGCYTAGTSDWGNVAALVDTWYISSVAANGASSFGRLNGTQQDANVGAASLGGIRVGCGDNNAENANMDLGELVVFARGLTQAQCIAVENQLKTKWGISW